MKKKLAVPELVLGLPWIVVEGLGKASPKDRLFSAPMGEDPHSRAVRAHELAHVRYSPLDPGETLLAYAREGGDPETLAVVEDARVNILAAYSGVPLSQLYPLSLLSSLSKSISSLSSATTREAKLYLARVAFTLQVHVKVSALDPHPEAGEIVRMTYSLLDKLAQVLGPIAPEIYRIHERLLANPYSFDMAKKCARAFDLLFPKDPEVGPLARQLLEIELSPSPSPIRPGAYDENAHWLPMRVQRAPLIRPIQEALASKRPADFGPFFAPHRLPPVGDGLVFLGRRPGLHAGGILIDDSGSMSISPSDLLSLVSSAPFALVAKYSSQEKYGTLLVLASRGRLAGPEDITRDLGPGNGIDGPALRWLVTNARPPYLWVTDTYVTGAGDRYNARLLRECMSIVSRHKVKICYTVGEAIEYLNKLRRWRRR